MSDLPLVLRLPLPPSVNHYFLNRAARVRKGLNAGKTYMARMLSAEGVAFRQEVLYRSRIGPKAPARLAGRLAVMAILFPADARRQDLDNRLKPLLDALVWAEVIQDDSQVDDLRILRGPVREGGLLLLALDRPRHVESGLFGWGAEYEANLFAKEAT